MGSDLGECCGKLQKYWIIDIEEVIWRLKEADKPIAQGEESNRERTME